MDPYDEFSRPLRVEKRDICVLYYLRPRKKWAGRELVVAYDERFPLAPEFKCRYSYVLRYLEKGNCAGNHYHVHKAEIIQPLVGEFEIKLEDIGTKKKESFLISSRDNVAFYAPTKVAHSMKSLGDTGLMLLTASAPAQESDIIQYIIG
jgi:mannose-6-phosphate isomerase-like protein (cupin superfamily)